MVRIRLRRMGAKKRPFYRVVVANQRSARNGRFIETIGTYDPLTEPPKIEIRADRVAHWLSVGAQPSDAVENLLKKQGLVDAAGKLVYQPETESTLESVAADVAENIESEENIEPEENVEAEDATAATPA